MRRAATAWNWFRSTGAAAKGWTLAGVALTASAVTLTATSTLAAPAPEATSTPTAAAPSSAGDAMGGSASATRPSGAPDASSSMAGMGGGAAATAPGASMASDICPNVSGATLMPNGMEMAPVPAGPPTAAQQAAADTLVAETTADVQKYSDLVAAEAAGYEPITSTRGPMTHYADWSLVGPANVLNPEAPPSLMYANTVDGPVLIGAMFFGPGPCEPGPDIGGSLTDWHAHANLCLNTRHQVVGTTDATGSCARGFHTSQTLFMLHVWTAPQLATHYQFQADLPSGALTPIVESGQP